MSPQIIIIAILVLLIIIIGGAIVSILFKKNKKVEIDNGVSFQQTQEPETYVPQLQQIPAPMNDLNTPQTPVMNTPVVDDFNQTPVMNTPVVDDFNQTPVMNTPVVNDFNQTPVMNTPVVDNFNQAPVINTPVVDDFNQTPVMNTPVVDDFNQTPVMNTPVVNDFNQTQILQPNPTPNQDKINQDLQGIMAALSSETLPTTTENQLTGQPVSNPQLPDMSNSMDHGNIQQFNNSIPTQQTTSDMSTSLNPQTEEAP